MTRKVHIPAVAAEGASVAGSSPVAAPPPTPAQAIQQKRAGFLSQMFKRLFKKSA